MKNVNNNSTPFFKLPDWYVELSKEIGEKLQKEATTKIKIEELAAVPTIYIPLLQEKVDEDNDMLGVIGGYYYQSTHGDMYIKSGYFPIVQLDLALLSKVANVEFGEGILELWCTGTEWAVVETDCDVTSKEKFTVSEDRVCLQLDPVDLEDADQYARAVAGFDWSESIYTKQLGLQAPIFITGIQDAGLNHAIAGNFEAYCGIDAKRLAEVDRILAYKLSTAFGNFWKDNAIECFKDSPRGKWLPLMTLDGTEEGFVDQWTIFYCRGRNGKLKYQAYCSRDV